MPRLYKKKREKSWSLNSIIMAIEDYKKNENKSCLAIANQYGIPEATFRRYLKKNKDEYPVHGGRFRDTFSENQLSELAKYISDIERHAFGLTRIQFQKLTYDFAEENGIPHRFNKKLKLAGNEWLQTFIRKYGFSFRTSKFSENSFNKTNADLFFSTLNELIIRNKYMGHQIYNADEFALIVVPSYPELISPYTKRMSNALSSEREQNVTVVCGMSASGEYIPPFFIFPDMTDFEIESDQDESEKPHECGWTINENFMLYLEHFITFAKPSCDNPILLLIDNQMMHTSLEVIKFCRNHFITLLGFPPHSTLNLQPIDTSLFGPLRLHYTEVHSDFMASHIGDITKDHICNLFGDAYNRVATLSTALNGFKACGIEPFNSLIFAEEIFETPIKDETETKIESGIFETSVEIKIEADMYSDCGEDFSDYFDVTQ